MVVANVGSNPIIPTRIDKMTNKEKGELVEQIVITEFLKLGIPVSKTLGDNQPYDIIIDLKNKLYKVQIRAGWKQKNTLKVSFQSSRMNTKMAYKTSNKNKVDLYVTYCFENNKCYVINVNTVKNINSICLQLNDNCKNGRVLNFAKDFELKTILDE